MNKNGTNDKDGLENRKHNERTKMKESMKFNALRGKKEHVLEQTREISDL